MSTSAKRSRTLEVTAILAFAVSGVIGAQLALGAAAGRPGTAPATTGSAAPIAGAIPGSTPTTNLAPRPLPGVDLTKTMQFVFADVPVSTILTNMSQRFGFIIINTGQLPTARVTVQNYKEVDAQEAIRLFNEILVPMGYVALVTNTEADTTSGAPANTILRVVTTAEGKKANIPVYKSSNPEDVPWSDDLRTQIIPLSTIAAPGLVNELRNFISADADIGSSAGSNSIVITDTSSKIRRLMEIVKNLDSAKKPDSVIEYRQLINSNASDAARLINAMFSPTNTGAGTTGAGGFGGGGGIGVPAGAAGRGGRGGFGGVGGGASAQPITARLYADSDSRTNTVVLNGPDDQVQEALDMLNRIEAIPLNYNDTSVFFMKHLKNAQTEDITPVLSQVFGGSSNTIGGTANRGTTTNNRSTSALSSGSLGGGGNRTGGGGTTGNRGTG